MSPQIKYSKAYQVPPTEELQFGVWGRICGVEILKILICLLGLYRMYVCLLSIPPTQLFMHITNNHSVGIFYSTEPHSRCCFYRRCYCITSWSLWGSYCFISRCVDLCVKHVPILSAAPPAKVSEMQLCRSDEHRRLTTNFHQSSCGRGRDMGHLKGMHLASLKILCYLSLRVTGWWYGLAQIR